jgi:hypothetical protein
LIPVDREWATGMARIVSADLLDTTSNQVRHDPAKLAAAILRFAQCDHAS